MSEQYPYMYNAVYYFRITVYKIPITIGSQEYNGRINVEFLIRSDPNSKGTSSYTLFETPLYALNNDLLDNDKYIKYKHIELDNNTFQHLKKILKTHKDLINELYNDPNIILSRYYNLLVEEEPEIKEKFFYKTDEHGKILPDKEQTYAKKVYKIYKNAKKKKIQNAKNSPIQQQILDIANSIGTNDSLSYNDLIETSSRTATIGFPQITLPKSDSTRRMGTKFGSSSRSTIATNTGPTENIPRIFTEDWIDTTNKDDYKLPEYDSRSTNSLPSYNKASGSKTARKSKSKR